MRTEFSGPCWLTTVNVKKLGDTMDVSSPLIPPFNYTNNNDIPSSTKLQITPSGKSGRSNSLATTNVVKNASGSSGSTPDTSKSYYGSLGPRTMSSTLVRIYEAQDEGSLLLGDEDSDDDPASFSIARGGSIGAGSIGGIRSRRQSLSAGTCAYLGLTLTLLSSVFSSLSGLTVKLLEDDFHPYAIAFWRFATIFLISGAGLLYVKYWSKENVWPRPLIEEKYAHSKTVFLLLVRGILGCSGRMMYIYSITCLTLADATVIASSSPVFMTFFAWFFIGESLGIFSIIIALVTLGGVVVITRPPWLTGGESMDQDVLVGTGTGIVGMILITLVMIAMRKLRHIHHTITTLSFASWGVVIALFLSYNNGVFALPTGLKDGLILIASGLSSFLGQTFLTLALKYEKAGPVALMKNFDVIFSFLWEFIILQVAPDIYSVAGGCIVILCIVLTTLRKWMKNLPEGHEIRETFSLFLK